MHDGMQYDPIQGQCHETLKVGNSKAVSSPIYNDEDWQMTTDSCIRAHRRKLIRAVFFKFCPSFCHVTLKLALSGSRPPVPYGANLYVKCSGDSCYGNSNRR